MYVQEKICCGVRSRMLSCRLGSSGLQKTHGPEFEARTQGGFLGQTEKVVYSQTMSFQLNPTAPQISYRQYLRERYGPETIQNFKKLEVLSTKYAQSANSLTFLHKCREQNLIPRGLRLKTTIQSEKANRIIRRAEESLVREQIQFHRRNKVMLNTNINTVNNIIWNTVNEVDFNRINNCVDNSYNRSYITIKRSQTNKFKSLVREKQEKELNQINNNQSFINRTVINLSSKMLNTSQKLILSKGLNFALTPKDVPTLDIITSIEETCQKLSEDVSNEFRIRSKMILEKPLKIKSNISKEEMLALKELKNDKDIKILPADKGNATVIMNTGDYNSKISNLITEGQYTKLNKDPTKNTPHFIEKLTTINIDSTELLVSFDVVSLFTNVPVDKTLSIVRNKLENDNNLKDRTKLNVSAFMELLTLCIKTTYFQLENDFYQQDFGMAMGSSLSPIMSNIFMEHFEETYVKSYINKPKIWWRYVDDVFSIWPHGQDNLTDFLNFLNNIEPTIKFTLELEENNKLPFLDVMISKNTEINSNFQTNVYRKKTNTNRYLNFDSNHHLSIKKGVIKSLYDRAKLVSSNVNFFNQEKDHIKNILKENAYPINLVDKAFLQIENPSHNNNQQRQNPVANMTIPYIPGISEKLKKLGNNFNIRTAFKTNNTLRSILTHTKPINKEQNEKNCIYQIPCQCGKHYIGETSRPLDVRIKEHKNYVRNYQVDRSNLVQHVWDNHHQINWKEASIIQKEQNFGKRKLKESACIQLNGDNCFSAETLSLNRTWLPLLKKDNVLYSIKDIDEPGPTLPVRILVGIQKQPVGLENVLRIVFERDGDRNLHELYHEDTIHTKKTKNLVIVKELISPGGGRKYKMKIGCRMIDLLHWSIYSEFKAISRQHC
ncbi:hypothetical protein NQ315_002949 [Exocentrus adspersus]|uniref:Reverse transcriptase domain-containing protein n=1 Tax=Exocentrus adspersus TaxID=1586481 RepID=A0AAV8W5L8_9CUCU|nr:hypothetical protein NQ315_002949 [Exocentrus adspersus]